MGIDTKNVLQKVTEVLPLCMVTVSLRDILANKTLKRKKDIANKATDGRTAGTAGSTPHRRPDVDVSNWLLPMQCMQLASGRWEMDEWHALILRIMNGMHS